MASFYPNSTNQRDDMTNHPYLRDSEQSLLYAESSNMMYFNYQPNGSYSELLASANDSHTIISQDSSSSHQHAYNNAWRGSLDNENDLVRNSVLLNGQSLALNQPKFSNVQGQGLSLSLGTQIPVSSFRYPSSDDNPRNKPSYGLNSSISNSKYLKAAQNLLNEVVNVQKALKLKPSISQSLNNSKDNDDASKNDGEQSNPDQESTAVSAAEISPSERQELQNKITKLLAMLDEVDRRYKQYYHQIQIIVSSFDAIAGCGAAKPYTALALQTISRHFRCLRDAISGQIQSTRKLLGEQESSSTKGCGISRLRFIDQELRQQRAMQQLGMLQQPHAWRPQRGLPETSVSLLRAWLFEHFLHPYPNDSEKLMLARQTGLTRGQVSNWFINARVRLWKPMIEEMYKEEFGETELESNTSSENANKIKDDNQSCDQDRDQPMLVQRPGHQTQTQFIDSSKPNLMIPNMEMGASSNFQHEAIENEEAYRAFQDNDRFVAYGTLGLTLGLQRGEEASDIYNTQGGSSLGFGPSHLLHDFVA